MRTTPNANIELSIVLSAYATIATTYTKTEADVLLKSKANQLTTYNKTEVDTLIANIPQSSYYTQTQLDTMFSTHYFCQTRQHRLELNVSTIIK